MADSGGGVKKPSTQELTLVRVNLLGTESSTEDEAKKAAANELMEQP